MQNTAWLYTSFIFFLITGGILRETLNNLTVLSLLNVIISYSCIMFFYSVAFKNISVTLHRFSSFLDSTVYFKSFLSFVVVVAVVIVVVVVLSPFCCVVMHSAKQNSFPFFSLKRSL